MRLRTLETENVARRQILAGKRFSSFTFAFHARKRRRYGF